MYDIIGLSNYSIQVHNWDFVSVECDTKNWLITNSLIQDRHYIDSNDVHTLIHITTHPQTYITTIILN